MAVIYVVSMEYAIEIEGLSKTYAAKGRAGEKIALSGVDLKIPKGSMFALLGPNGAGKSTLINIMAGLVNKTAGKVRVWDCDLDNKPIDARYHIGVVEQEVTFNPFFTPFQVLDIQAGLYGVPKKERRTMELLELVGLADKAHAWSRQLSGGMKRRLMVAKAMVHNPEIIVLDEPTAGVDIELRTQLWENVQMLNKQGATILLTTHYLEEAEKLCDEIAIINNGKIVAHDKKEALLSQIDAKEIHFKLDRELSELPVSLKDFNANLVNPARIGFFYSPKETNPTQFIEAMKKTGIGITDITTKESDLEDVFLQITKKSA
jgi:ABC-2 type transport system ATP-binding protein